MLTDYASAGLNELWNTTRLQAYLTNVGSPFDTGPSICTCPSLTAEITGAVGPAYTTPDAVVDPAPWYDPAVPESAEFLGFLPLDIQGVDDSPYTRNTTNVVGGNGVFGPQRVQPRTITVSGVLIGATCCATAYGLHYFTEVLAGTFSQTNPDACGACTGDTLIMYNCCPDPGMEAVEFRRVHQRNFRRTALVEGPTVTRRRGSGTCATSNCAAGSELIEVEFVLVAAVPWAYTEQSEVLNVFLPIGGQPAQPCVDWCLTPTGITCESEVCLHQDCSVPVQCADPLNPVVAPPEPTIPASTFCVPLAPERACYLIDLSGRPAWAEDVPIVTISSGGDELRNVRVTFYEAPSAATNCATFVDQHLCEPVDDFVVTYMPAASTVTIDGQVGRAFIQCGGPCVSASTAYSGDDGGPLKVNGLKADYYCVCIETDPLNPPDAGATISISLSGRGY